MLQFNLYIYLVVTAWVFVVGNVDDTVILFTRFYGEKVIF